MKQYIRPEILATYTVEELVEEAATCADYGGAVDIPVSSSGS
jgi:hypothetical protein